MSLAARKLSLLDHRIVSLLILPKFERADYYACMSIFLKLKDMSDKVELGHGKVAN